MHLDLVQVIDSVTTLMVTPKMAVEKGKEDGPLSNFKS